MSLSALALAIALPSPARADDDDLLSSVFTESGFELRRDDRLFVLYAALNVAGYDRAEQIRSVPFPKYAFHPLRLKLRNQLAPLADTLRPPVEHFVDAHPEAIEEYVAAALTLAAEPPYAASATTPKLFAGLDTVLSEFATGAHLTKLSRGLAMNFREVLKKLRTPVDAPFSGLRKAYHLNEESAPNLVLVPNPLDAPDVAIARLTADGSHVVVFGLAADEKDLDLKVALHAYSALLAAEATANVTADGLSSAVDRLHADGVLSHDVTEGTIIRDSMKAAVEAKLWSKDAQSAVDEAYRRGLIFAREFLKALAEPADSFPADKGSFASQVAAKLDIDKTLTEVARGSNIKK